MATRATVNFRALHADAQFRAIYAEISRQPASMAVVSERELYSAVTFRNLQQSVTFRQLHQEFQFRALDFDAYVLAKPNVFVHSNEFSVSDSMVRDLSLGRKTTYFSISDALPAFTVTSAKSESFSLAESFSYSASTVLSDSTAVTDSPSWIAEKPFSHGFSVSDSSPDLLIDFGVLPSSNVSFADSSTLDISASLSDAFALDDIFESGDVASTKANIFSLADDAVLAPFYSSALLNKPIIGNTILNSP